MTGILLADQGTRVLKSIVLDSRASAISADMDRLRQLMQRADALIESAEPGASDHADLTYARAHGHNPRFVCCTITSYGGLATPHQTLTT
jgi:alpha-methylacyl-CoA racemase